MTRIERLQKTGIIRSGTPTRGFKYRQANSGKVSRADLQRILSLKVPPAWIDVAINGSAGGMLQAVGKDATRPLAVSLPRESCPQSGAQEIQAADQFCRRTAQIESDGQETS